MMQSKIIIGLTSFILLSTSNIVNYSSFQYKYQIRTNSYSPLDEAAGYYYKEQMIYKFEYELFTLDSNEHTEYVINNLNNFKLTDDANVEYQMGIICVTLGNGKGRTIKGNFRKNECDEKVIREKYYILELFQ